MVKRFAGIIEAGRVGGVDRKFARGTHVHAGQVADGVVVLGIAQTPRQHHARVARTFPRFRPAHRLDPGDHLLANLRWRLLHHFRRHLFGAEPARYRVPTGEILNHLGQRGVALQVQICRSRGATVAPDTVSGDKGPHGLLKTALEIGFGRLSRT